MRIIIFGKKFMLMVRLWLVGLDMVCSKEIFHFLRDFYLSRFTNEEVHGSPIPDLIVKGVNKLTVSLNGVDISHQCFPTNIEGSYSGTIVNCLCITEDEIRGYWFISPMNIEGRITGFKVLPHVGINTFSSMPSGNLESFLNGFHRLVSKIGAKCHPIWFLVLDLMFINGLFRRPPIMVE